MLSIVIPTLNEGKYLPKLLKSINPVRGYKDKQKIQSPQTSNGIKKQDFDNYEIIVADAGSSDKTKEIAKKYGCVVIPGGLPARGRNNGAKRARGELILFLDADIIVPENFLEETINEFKRRKLKIASFFLVPLKGKKVFRLFLNIFYNFPIRFMERILPHGAMGVLIERTLFEKLKGFDETIKLAEDHDLVRRAAELGKFGIIKSCPIFISDRRFKKDGWFRTYFKYIFCEIHMIFIGPIRSDILKYRFDHYSKNKNNKV